MNGEKPRETTNEINFKEGVPCKARKTQIASKEDMQAELEKPASADLSSGASAEEEKSSEATSEEIQKLFQENKESKEKNILDFLLTRLPSNDEMLLNSTLESLGPKSMPIELYTGYAVDWRSVMLHKSWLGEEVGDKKVNDIFYDKINNKILLDLGGADGDMKEILDEAGIKPKYYINVDKFYFKTPFNPSVKQINEKNPQTKNEWFYFDDTEQGRVNVLAGMLSFLQYIEDSSVDAISMNGVGDDVIPAEKYESTDYHEELSRQITRVLKSGGILINRGSDVWGADSDFKTIWKRGVYQLIRQKLEESKENS